MQMFNCDKPINVLHFNDLDQIKHKQIRSPKELKKILLEIISRTIWWNLLFFSPKRKLYYYYCYQWLKLHAIVYDQAIG